MQEKLGYTDLTRGYWENLKAGNAGCAFEQKEWRRKTLDVSQMRQNSRDFATQRGWRETCKHQGVSLGDVMINNGSAELNCILTATCSNETISLPKKIQHCSRYQENDCTLRQSCFKKWTPNLKKGGDVPKDLIGRWKMFTAEKLVVAYLLSLKIGFLLYAKILN